MPVMTEEEGMGSGSFGRGRGVSRASRMAVVPVAVGVMLIGVSPAVVTAAPSAAVAGVQDFGVPATVPWLGHNGGEAATKPSKGASFSTATTGWSSQSTVNEVVHSAQLNAVACPVAGQCLAVGGEVDGAGNGAALVETLSSQGWKMLPHSVPRGSIASDLDAVSCGGADWCVATGWYERSTGGTSPLVESWDGSTWSFVPVGTPRNSTASVLDSISCTTTGQCMAGGWYIGTKSSSRGWSAYWNGGSWTDVSTVQPSGATSSSLAGVSCTPAGTVIDCTTVGWYQDGQTSSDSALSLSWSGTSWSLSALVQPTGDVSDTLSGVSCTSATICTAVGSYQDSTGDQFALIEKSSGGSWTLGSAAEPGTYANNLVGVVCSSPTACTAVGSYGNTTNEEQSALGESWNGVSWSVDAAVVPGGWVASDLLGVSCDPTGTCAAVGYYQNGVGTPEGLAESISGGTWTLQAVHDPQSATQGTYLEGVSCISGACLAVGSAYDNNDIVVSLAEYWDGTSWAMESPPHPKGASASALEGVSCTSPTECLAVGWYRTSSGSAELSYADQWDGASWTLMTTANPVTTAGFLTGVSCTSPGACTAVGWYENAAGTFAALVDDWNGTSWSLGSVASVSGSVQSSLAGVSCPQAGACLAVGAYENQSGVTVPLTELESGSTWTASAAAQPAGAAAAQLDSVSCPLVGTCTAVGSSTASIGSAPTALVESLSGSSWTVAPVSQPTGAAGSSLNGVSCAPSGPCVAVGVFTESSSFEQRSFSELTSGSSWTVAPTQNPGLSVDQLIGVSCDGSVGTCVAVGSHTGNDGPLSLNTYVTLAEATGIP